MKKKKSKYNPNKSYMDKDGVFHASSIEELGNFVDKEAAEPLGVADLLADTPITYDMPDSIRGWLIRGFNKLPKTDHNKMLIWILKARKGFYIENATGKHTCMSYRQIADYFKTPVDMIKELEREGFRRVQEAIGKSSIMEVPFINENISERRIIIPENDMVAGDGS